MKMKMIQEIIEYIEEHITEVISLNEIGELINYSSYYCSTSFRKHVGTSIKNYTRKRRLQLASEDLIETDMRIIDVAMKYCYSSQEAFSRAFVNSFGLSPFAFRKKKLPISTFDGILQLSNKREQLINKNKIIDDLQKEIAEKYPVNVLHVLNGSCMLDEFTHNGHFNESSVYIPFNEAMCWGDVDKNIFSDEFIEQRVKSLKTTVLDYKTIVMQPLETLFKDDYNTIVLWFGADMFCQLNMLTILAYLDHNKFSGDVLFCMKNEVLDEMLPDAYEIDTTGSYEKYVKILCDHEMPEDKMLPVMYQTVKLYLNYRADNSEINTYIKRNINKERKLLITDLMKTYPQYGLGDLQFEMMIDLIIEK